MTENSKSVAVAALTVPNPASTYQTVVRPHQLRRGDIVADPYAGRDVMVNTVTHGELKYRGAYAPVLFVSAVDTVSGREVQYTRTEWEFLEVTRIGVAPQFRNVTKVLDQYVY